MAGGNPPQDSVAVFQTRNAEAHEMSYFKPRTKTELVRWLANYWPSEASSFRQKGKHELYAIYYSVIRGIAGGRYPSGKGSN
jgi:hypothetical protein